TVGSSQDYTQTGGSTTLTGGNLTTGGLVDIRGGSLIGTGTVTGNVANAGQVSPGASPGILNIAGNYTQTSNGTLNIELAGFTPGTEFDRLAVSGAATLDGTLNVALLTSFTVHAGDSFQVLTFGSRTGDFAIKNGFGLPGGLGFQESFSPASMTLVTSNVGITVQPTTGLITTEAGGTATFTVVLNSQPTADVTIGLSSSNPNQGTVSVPSLTFTAANWNVPQTVTVTGVEDFIDDGDIAYTIL